MNFSFEIKSVDKKLNSELLEDFPGERTGFVQIGSKKWFLTEKYKKQAAGYYGMPLKKDDVWVVTYPRSGTTLTQELVWLINNDLQYEKAQKQSLFQRFPFLECTSFIHPEFLKEIIAQNSDNKKVLSLLQLWNEPGYNLVSNIPSPRYIKSHLPLDLLPPTLLDTCKVIYVARNPKDVAVSYYHHNKLINIHGYHKDFSTYWEYFQKGLLLFSPYWSHVIEAWEQRNHPNMLFLFYEDLTDDMPGCINKVAEFLGKQINSQEVEKLANHLHIDNFRKNSSIQGFTEIKGLVRKGEQDFIRKGGIGGSKTYFTKEMNEDADKWIMENLKTTDLRFPKYCL